MNTQEKWDKRFLKQAEEWASYSKDSSTKVGAIISKNINDIVSQGYNGFPEGDPDLKEHYEDRNIKYPKIIHAEINALKKAMWNGQKSLIGCTLYTIPLMPCSECAKILIAFGLERVVSYRLTGNQIERWGKNIEKSIELFEERGIEIIYYEREKTD